MFWKFVIIPVVTIAAASVHLMLTSQPRPVGKVLEIWVVHMIFWGVGVLRLIGGYFMANDPSAVMYAQQLHWSSGSPFQTVFGGQLMALGICGLGVAWFRGGWLLAVSMAAIVFGWGETILFIVAQVPFWPMVVTLLYNLLGSLLLITLLAAYRWRAGAERFWRPVAEIYEYAEE